MVKVDETVEIDFGSNLLLFRDRQVFSFPYFSNLQSSYDYDKINLIKSDNIQRIKTASFTLISR